MLMKAGMTKPPACAAGGFVLLFGTEGRDYGLQFVTLSVPGPP